MALKSPVAAARSPAIALLAGSLLLTLAPIGLAQPSPAVVADPRVEKTLNELKWSFKTDADGDYSLVLNTEDGRNQLVIVRSRTFQTGRLDQRELWSAAALVDPDVDLETGRALLSLNLQVKFGFWCTIPQEQEKKHLVMYIARIPSDCDAETFSEYCQGVADVADALEQELSEQDQY